jgi:putative DNA primase/helicase
VLAHTIPADCGDAPHGIVVQLETPTGAVEQILLDRATAHSPRFATELANAGAQIDPARTVVLARYLANASPARRIVTFNRSGWHEKPAPAFVLGNEVIGPSLDATVTGGAAASPVAVAGNLHDWLRHVARPACRAGVRWWRLTLLSTVTAPLLKAADQPSFGIHGVGTSSLGKTIGLRIAASVFGGKELVASWNTTAAAIEAAAQRTCDLPLLLDEIAEADVRTLGRTIYAVANEAGRARLRPDASARPRTRWRTTVLSTGEHTIESRVMGTRERLAGGQAVRMLEILIDGHQRGSGMTRRLPHMHVRRLEAAVQRFHGAPGRMFVERLVRAGFGNSDSAVARRFRLKVDQIAAALAGSDKDPRRQRAARAFALLRLAGELAVTWRVLPREISPGDTVRRAWGAWKRNNTSSTDDARSAARRLVDLIDGNIDGRILEIGASAQREKWGWYRTEGDALVVFVLRSLLSKALRGLPVRAFLLRAQAAGALIRRGDGRNAQVKVPGVRGNPRAYEFSLARLQAWAAE